MKKNIKSYILLTVILVFGVMNMSDAKDNNGTSKSPDKASFEKPSKDVLKKILTPEQYNCTQEEGTEAPFKNAYWNHHEDGIYVDVVSGEALFSSLINLILELVGQALLVQLKIVLLQLKLIIK